MNKGAILFVLAIGSSFLTFTARAQIEEKSAPQTPMRSIPAITSVDRFPHGCVDCHINYPEMKMDTRISTIMKQWNNEVDPKLLAKVRASASSEIVLKGKHPIVADALKDIPAGCLKCHSKESKEAPPMSQMLHLIHLSGGEENHFLSLFQGECTHCHKLNLSTGRWSMPSGPEQ
jgi:hypothetical protein